MGILTFLLPDDPSAEAVRCLDRACLAIGYDQSPVPTRRNIEGGRLDLTKDANESGYLSMPWPISGSGTPVIHSATLREQAEPYHLVLELARGKLNQVRNLTAEWESIGMTIDPEDRAALGEAARLFGLAVTNRYDPESTTFAERVLELSLRSSDRLTRSFAVQLLQTRLSESGKLTTAVGCKLARTCPSEAQERIAEDCNAVRLTPNWRTIEPTEAGYDWTEFDAQVDWAIRAGLRVSVGPLIDLGGSFPDWLVEWNADLPSLAAFACDFVETVIRRYQDRVKTWQVFAGFNHADALGLGEDDRIRLAARLLEAARQTEPDGDWVIGLAQPWGDYLASEDYTYSPLVFADTLIRAGFSLSALEVELMIGDGTRASHPRDPLEAYRILELFSVLGIPLEVAVGVESVSGGNTNWYEETVLELAVALPQVRSVYWLGVQEDHLQSVPSVLSELRHRFVA